jgi:hypothetical protein
MLLKKKSQVGSFYNIKLLHTKYQNNIDDFNLIQKKQNYSKIKVYCKQNGHFYRDFF